MSLFCVLSDYVCLCVFQGKEKGKEKAHQVKASIKTFFTLEKQELKIGFVFVLFFLGNYWFHERQEMKWKFKELQDFYEERGRKQKKYKKKEKPKKKQTKRLNLVIQLNIRYLVG